MSEEETTLELRAGLVAGSDGGIVPSELFSGERSFESLSKAELDVLAERFRQVSEEGFTSSHDDTCHDCGAMARAAACYARGAQFLLMHKMRNGQGTDVDVPVEWPWSPDWWKPRSRREDLVRSAALILAEIERLDRVAAGEAASRDNPSPTGVGDGWIE